MNPREYLGDLWGAPPYERLPERVRAIIADQQARSEILIGWVQLAVVTAFGILYAVAPKTFRPDAMFAPVPWALSGYLAFTLARLWLAQRRRLPDWFLYMSVVADMLLLLGLIWSFHLQYEQPASFYLKAPTLLYVFIFIALRALRYEVRFVLLAGGVAAAGWLILVAYVITIDPHDPMITRDYVQYLTSNSVLLGAEFDKVISILMVTVILAVAIARARRTLVRSVMEGVAAEELSRFVPTQVARQVKTAERRVAVGEGLLREATVLFTDIEGFTTLGESMTPEQLISTLNDYFAAVAAPIEAHGGVINQFQGDAILATFNLPDEVPEHAAQAVRCAIAMQRIVAGREFGHGVRLRTRVGINTGVIVGGLVGTAERVGYTVHGDDVNLAARLEALNKEHGTRIMVSHRTRELAGPDEFAFRAAGEVTVRGRTRPVSIYTLDADDA